MPSPSAGSSLITAGISNNWTPSLPTLKAEDTNINRGINGKFNCNDSFSVEKITYDDNGNIDGLAIINRNNKRVFTKVPKK